MSPIWWLRVRVRSLDRMPDIEELACDFEADLGISVAGASVTLGALDEDAIVVFCKAELAAEAVVLRFVTRGLLLGLG